MNRVGADQIAELLDSVESRSMTIDECCAIYPADADELRDIFSIVRSISPRSTMGPTAEFRSTSRRALLETIFREQAVTERDLARSSWWNLRILPMRRFTSMSAVIVALVVTLASASGGVVLAAQDSLPGDALYRVKTSVEGIRVAIAGEGEARAELEMERAIQRLEEARRAARAGREDAVHLATRAAIAQIVDADLCLGFPADSEIEAAGKMAANLKVRIAQVRARLVAAIEQSTDQARGALREAAEKACAGLANASARAATRVDAADRRALSPARAPGIPAHATAATEVGVDGSARLERGPAARGRADASVRSEVAVTAHEDQAEEPEATGDGRREDLAARLRANLERVQARLAEVIERAPAQAEGALTEAEARVGGGLRTAIGRTEDRPDRGEHRPPDTPRGEATATPAPASTAVAEIEARSRVETSFSVRGERQPGSDGAPTAPTSAPPAAGPGAGGAARADATASVEVSAGVPPVVSRQPQSAQSAPLIRSGDLRPGR